MTSGRPLDRTGLPVDEAAGPTAPRPDPSDPDGVVTGRAGRAGSPAGVPPWSRAGLSLVVRGAARECWQDRIFGLGAETAFWQLLSLPPLLIALLGLVGFVARRTDPAVVSEIQEHVVDGLSRVLAPQVVQEIVAPAVNDVLANGRLALASLSFLLSLWAGSTAMATYVNTITIAYNLRGVRSTVRARLVSLGLHLGGVVVVAVLLPAMVLGPGLLVRLAPDRAEPQVRSVVGNLYWPAVVILGLALLTSLYHLAIPVRTKWRRQLPGALLAFAIWLVGSFAVREYFEFALSVNSAYRTLGASIAVLLFFYVTGVAVLIGAEVNAELDLLWPQGLTDQVRRGRRSGSVGRLGARPDPARGTRATGKPGAGLEGDRLP